MSQTTFIYHKRPNLSEIHNILQTTRSKVHTIPSSQVQYKKTTPKAAHGDCEGWDAPACDPGDGPGGDGPTCDAGDPSTWFDAAPIDAAKKRGFMNRYAILLDCYHLLIHMPPVLKKITTTDMRLFILMHSLFYNVSS